MRKRILAIAMALCLIITLLPATALAADGTRSISVGGETINGSADAPGYARVYNNPTDRVEAWTIRTLIPTGTPGT